MKMVLHLTNGSSYTYDNITTKDADGGTLLDYVTSMLKGEAEIEPSKEFSSLSDIKSVEIQLNK